MKFPISYNLDGLNRIIQHIFIGYYQFHLSNLNRLFSSAFKYFLFYMHRLILLKEKHW